MELLTNSRRRAFNACRYRHHLEYERAIKPVERIEAIEFGDIAHKCLEAYWRSRQAREPQEVPLGRALDLIPDALDPFTRAKLQAMLCGYATIWDDEAVEVLAVEQEFTMPLIDPDTGKRHLSMLLAGKIDLVVRLADGRVAIVEHKTTSADFSAGSDYREKLALDGQISQYLAARRDAQVVIYDVLGKPELKPLKATPQEARRYRKKDGALDARQRDRDETPGEYRERCVRAIEEAPGDYFARVEVVRFDSQRVDYARDVWATAMLIQLTRALGIADRNENACFKDRSPCAFWAHCSGTASLDDATRYRRGTPHEELSEVAHAAE